MASSAFSAQGLVLSIGTGSAGAKTLTAVTQANPGVATSAAHGLSNGDVGAIAGVVGMTQLNGTTQIVSYKTLNAFALTGTDTTGFTAYTSGGTFTPTTFTPIKNARGTLTYDDGSSVEIDVTNFQSVAKEFIFGLVDSGNAKFEIDIDNSDAGQIALQAAKVAAAIKTFKIVLPAGTTPNVTFTAYVKQFTRSAGVDQVVKGQVDLRISGPVVYS